VFRAFDPERDRLVAVKRFQLDVPPERVRELVAEFERLIAAALTHPVIAAPVAAGLDGTVAYLASEYVSADSLDIVVREYGQAPPAEALRVATQVAGALDFAAVVNLHHGSLHARDVLLASGDTRITGLGVAAALEHIGVAAPVRRPYAAPERIAGGDWDRRADIFSLAALIYELLWARRIAGTGSAAADGIVAIDGADVGTLRDVFARALAEDPRARFDTALEFAAALNAAFPAVATTSNAGEATVAVPRLPLEALEDAPPLETRPREPDAIVIPPAVIPKAEPPDLPIHHASPTRFVDLPGVEPVAKESAGIGMQGDAAKPASALRRVPPPEEDSTPEPEFMASALEQSRSAIWPLMLALVVGIALGFAGGYSVGSHDRSGSAAVPPATASTAPSTTPSAPPPPASTTAEPAPAGASATSERPSTDVASSDAPKPPAAEPPEATQPASTPTAAPRPAAPSAAPAAFAGGLLVRSTPSGARVFVDGHEYGKTPIAVRELARGQHRVRIVRDGFSTEERRVVLTMARPSQSMVVPLAAISPTRAAAAASPSAAAATTGHFSGALTVESRPPEAKVYLDGVLIGTTPLQVPTVAAGEHAVRLEHDGYRHWSSSVRVVATETSRVTASLEK
jgi:serine/threonine-protein kinase